MNVNPLIDLIKQNFSDLDSLRQLQTAIDCMIEEQEYKANCGCIFCSLNYSKSFCQEQISDIRQISNK